MEDFDKLFERYISDWFSAHKDDYENADEMEAAVPALYERWADEPSAALGGQSPRGYLDEISDPAALVGLLANGERSALLLDRIAAADGVEKVLTAIVKTSGDRDLTMTAMNLLNDRGVYPFDVYAGWLADRSADSECRELAVELMTERADLAADLLFPLIDGADGETKTLLAEILANGPRDERTYRLLTELFLGGGNVPLYAGYLGKYGDERAAGMLYRALDDCDYLEYLEIKNAIERMGGVVDDTRDFSQDPYYKALKHIK